MPDPNRAHVLYRSVVTADGDTHTPAPLTHSTDLREKIVLAKPWVSPVVFIPGIMGTNLRNADSKKKAWRPPNADLNGAANLIGQLFNYAFKSTEKRAAELQTPRSRSTPPAPSIRATAACRSSCWPRAGGAR